MNSWNFLEITLRPLMTGCILNKNKLHLPPQKWFLMFSSHGSFRKKTISAPRDFRSHTFGLFSQFLEQLGRAIGG